MLPKPTVGTGLVPVRMRVERRRRPLSEAVWTESTHMGNPRPNDGENAYLSEIGLCGADGW